jgi:large subunit ribosomal protein L35
MEGPHLVASVEKDDTNMSAKVKVKTNRGAAKRILNRGSGVLRRAHSHKNHILTKKSSKRKRQLTPMAGIAPSDQRGIRLLLPYKG